MDTTCLGPQLGLDIIGR